MRIAASGVASGGRFVASRSSSAPLGVGVGDRAGVEGGAVLRTVAVVVDQHVVGLERFVVVEERCVVVDGQAVGGDERLRAAPPRRRDRQAARPRRR